MKNRSNILPDNKRTDCSLIITGVVYCAALFVMLNMTLHAQVISNNSGAVISNTSGTVVVTENFENGTGSILNNNGTITTATLTNNGTLQGNGTYNISSVFTNTGTFSIGTSTVNFNGSGAQTIPAYNYYNLISSSSGDRTLANSGTIGIAGAFTPGTNSYTITGSTIDFNGSGSQTIPAFNYYNLTSNSTGARTLASSGTIGIANVFTPGTNSYTVTGSTIDFNGSSAQTIPLFTYNHLTLTSSSAVTKSLGGAITVNGNLAVNVNNTLDDAGFQITGNATGTMTMAAGTTLILGSASTATAFPTNYITANISLNVSSTVVYNSDQTQAISTVPTYGFLTLTSTATVTKNIGGTVNIASDLTVNGNNTLNILGAGVVNVTGNFNLTGTLLNDGIINVGP